MLLSNASKSTATRNFRTWYQKISPTYSTILRWVKSFRNLGSFESRTDLGRPRLPSRWCKQAKILLPSAPKKVTEKSNCRHKDPVHHHTEQIENASSHVSVDDDNCTSVTSAALCSISCLSSIVYGQHAVSFRFLTSDSFCDECIFHISRLSNTYNTRTWGTKTPREIKQHGLRGKIVTVWCAVHVQWCGRSILI